MSAKSEVLMAPGESPDLPEKPLSARERIVVAACELFYRKGIRAVGVESIAEEANTTKMSLYRNFASKDELVAEWLRRHNDSFWRDWDEKLGRNPDDPRGQLMDHFNELTRHISDPDGRGCPAANAAVELTEPDHPARKVLEDFKAEYRNRLLDRCTHLGATDPAGLADALFLLAEGAQSSTQSLGKSGPGLAVARAAEMLIDGYLR
jgi:AcrR family transcriptional regulator